MNIIIYEDEICMEIEVAGERPLIFYNDTLEGIVHELVLHAAIYYMHTFTIECQEERSKAYKHFKAIQKAITDVTINLEKIQGKLPF